MNSFVKSLYYGEISPWERGRSKDPRHALITHKIIDIQKYLRSDLTPEQWAKFEELENLYAQSWGIENFEVFSYGLNMGVLLMIDVIDFKEKQGDQLA